MADVFISYKKSDADRVRPLVTHLRDAGLDVWRAIRSESPVPRQCQIIPRMETSGSDATSPPRPGLARVAFRNLGDSCDDDAR